MPSLSLRESLTPQIIYVQDYEVDIGLVIFRFFFLQMQWHTE